MTWLLLPTKDCKCGTCEKARELVDEEGALRLGRTTCTCAAGDESIAHEPSCATHLNGMRLFPSPSRDVSVK